MSGNKSSFTRFVGDTSGAAFIFTGLGLIVMMAFVGVAIDIGNNYYQKRTLQSAADAAAMAAALELQRDGATWTAAKARGEVVATSNGYTDNGSSITVTLYNPPQTPGTYLPDPNDYVEAVITSETVGFINSAISSGTTNVGARAIATTRLVNSCVYALEPSSHSGAVTVAGGVDVDLNCGIIANSTAPDAIDMNGGPCLTATGLVTAGGISGSSTCSVGTTMTSAPPADDPFYYLTPPVDNGCDYVGPVTVPGGNNTFGSADDDNFDDMVNFCGGLRMTGGVTNFESNMIYIIDTFGLDIAGGATVSAPNVMFYFPDTAVGPGGGPPDKKWAIVQITGNPPVTMSAMTAPPAGHPEWAQYVGILFYQNPSPVRGDLSAWFTGDSNLSLTGVLYFPASDVRFAGNTNSAADWTILVTRTVTFNGAAEITAGAVPIGVMPMALTQPTLMLTE